MQTHVFQPVLWLAVCLPLTACQRQEVAFPLHIATVEKLDAGNTRALSIENESEKTLHVWITDAYGDSHRHTVILGDVSRQQALDLLHRKQALLHEPR